MAGYDSLLARAAGDLPQSLLTGGQWQRVSRGLWELWGRRAACYTMGESTSLPARTADRLLQSLIYSIGLQVRTEHDPRRLQNGDLEGLLRDSWNTIEGQMKEARRLLARLKACPPPVANRAWLDTLDQVQGCFGRYDYRFFAHEVPCSIDYPLCQPADESLQGMEYLLAYLGRWELENRFLRRFGRQEEAALLEACCPDCRGLLLNLYQPVADNVLGCALLRLEVPPLGLTPPQRQQLVDVMARSSAAASESLLADAAAGVCRQLALGSDQRDCLLACAGQLLPRLRCAAAHGSLNGVFFDTAAAPAAAPRARYTDNRAMEDQELRGLLEQLSDCSAPAEKTALVLARVTSLRDLTEVLGAGLWQGEAADLLDALDPDVLDLLAGYVREQGEGWHSPSGWETELRRRLA